VKTVSPDRGPPPPAPAVPPGPDIQEGSGKHGIGSTYERVDVLETAHDEDLFDYYGSCALAFVDTETGSTTRFGKPDLFGAIQPSPDGAHFIVERIHRPYSHLHPWWRFPREVEIWDIHAQVEHRIASLPLADQVPLEGVPTGPRFYQWRPTDPATLFYVEALDGGDPDAKVPHRDRLLTWAAPFSGKATEAFQLKERFDGIAWTDSSGIALVDEYDRERRWETTYAADLSAAGAAPRVIWDLSANEKYKDPGTPVYRPMPNGFWVIDRDGPWIYLAGGGATPAGDRPFLDRFDLKALHAERLFRCDSDVYESFAGWAGSGRTQFLTRRESPTDPPNTYVRTLGAPVHAAAGGAAWASTLKPITRFLDPTPQLRSITKRIVTYKRADGTPLSFTLYLPPGYKQGTRLPTVLWAYPLEYSDEGTAGQVVGSDRRFTQITGASPLFFALDGYAVLNDAAMPVIGSPDSVYNVYLDQLVANAKAAIDKAAALGVTDPERVGVAGHSHGAFMTANLLAHSNLFRAGIARSGAYNHTLRPFGFQSERRTYFQAPESYIRLSPELHADQIREPILIIHGEDDANPGTVPLQSDLLYRAIVGTGGTARLVMLPFESHNYEAKESIEETLWEMMTWFARYVKEAPARASAK
jgi:dipeptidyl aminopeptidase/acylaminoacyl peptidase